MVLDFHVVVHGNFIGHPHNWASYAYPGLFHVFASEYHYRLELNQAVHEQNEWGSSGKSELET